MKLNVIPTNKSKVQIKRNIVDGDLTEYYKEDRIIKVDIQKLNPFI